MRKAVFVAVLIATAAAMLLVGRVRAGDGDTDFGFHGDHRFYPGNLVVSRSVYDNNANNVPAGTILPPDCPAASGSCNTTPTPYSGLSYPYVWNNDLYDGSFGITSKIYLDQITPSGWWINSVEVPSDPQHDHLVTSFSSKSELALNLSTDRKYLTFLGYVAPIDALDISNSNTPGAIDTTDPVGTTAYRAIAQVDEDGHFQFTETNAYSGNNGRAAIYYHGEDANFYFTAGNAGNGANPQPNGIILGAGAQILSPVRMSEKDQTPGTPTPVGGFSVTELGDKADKVGKDTNFRGLTIFDNVLYYTKGSGGNGVDTVYFVDTTGTACPSGSGLPAAGATLPTTPLAYNLATLQTSGLPDNMCILAGFPTNLAKSATSFPFGIWFANATTLYLADEGDGNIGNIAGTDPYADAKAQTSAGLQKWIFNSSTKRWQLAYVLQSGLELGEPYTVPGYPTGVNPAQTTSNFPDGLPWSPATDGLRNITGRVNWDGTVTIWAITSTVSGNGDQGADPNRLVAITDLLPNTDPGVAGTETFRTIRTAGFGEVLRGVAFTPGTDASGFFPLFDRDGDERGR